MAIDSASKRASALGFGFIAITLVIPDGTLDQGDRQTIADQYSGILASAPSLAPDVGTAGFSIITSAGDQGLSAIDNSALASFSAIETSTAGLSIINSNGGQGFSTIDPDGVAGESGITDVI